MVCGIIIPLWHQTIKCFVMNNLIIEAWPMWGMVTAIMTCVYLFWPSKYMKKNEYVAFFLSSFSLYWLLMLLIHIYIGGFRHVTPLSGSLFLVCLIPWITVTHLLYPFKQTKRNQQFTFLSVTFTSVMLLLIAFVWILVQFSNM